MFYQHLSLLKKLSKDDETGISQIWRSFYFSHTHLSGNKPLGLQVNGNHTGEGRVSLHCIKRLV